LVATVNKLGSLIVYLNFVNVAPLRYYSMAKLSCGRDFWFSGRDHSVISLNKYTSEYNCLFQDLVYFK